MSVPILRIDVPARSVSLAGYPITLTRKEFDLLTLMCHNSDRVVSRDEIFSEVWGWNFVGGTKTLDMHVVALRKKMGYNGSNSPIITVRGIGFRFDQSQVVAEISNGKTSWELIGDEIIVTHSNGTKFKITGDDLTTMINVMYSTRA